MPSFKLVTAAVTAGLFQNKTKNATGIRTARLPLCLMQRSWRFGRLCQDGVGSSSSSLQLLVGSTEAGNPDHCCRHSVCKSLVLLALLCEQRLRIVALPAGLYKPNSILHKPPTVKVGSHACAGPCARLARGLRAT